MATTNIYSNDDNTDIVKIYKLYLKPISFIFRNNANLNLTLQNKAKQVQK